MCSQRVGRCPSDVLGAATEAMIGYMIGQEMGNLLPVEVTGKAAAIGALADLHAMVDGRTGTINTGEANGIECHEPA